MFAFDASQAAKMIKLKMAKYTKVPFLTGYASVDIFSALQRDLDRRIRR